MTSNVLSFFWHLASSSKDTRVNASIELVNSLENFQRSYIASKADAVADEDSDDDDDDEDDESGEEVDGSEEEEDPADARRLDRALTRGNAEDVVYTVRRLVRGLASSRESSRLGFAVALTELLTRINTVSAPQVLSILIRSSPYIGSMKGSDGRDALFARLFGLTSIVQSRVLYRESSDLETFERVIEEFIELGETKAWLRESAWFGVVGATEALLDSEVVWKEEGVRALVDRVYEEKAWSQEKVALTLLLEQRRPTLQWKTLLAPTFKHAPLLHASNLVTLGKLLKESDAEDEDEGIATSASTGSWKPQLHFVWNYVIDTYFSKTPVPPSPHIAQFQDFFRVVVDESLFSNASSSERKYWGFSVLVRTLPIVPSAQLPFLFTPNVMRTWINNLSSPDRYLHKVALSLAKQVQDVVKANPTVGFTLLSALVGKNGRADFDKATKTKTVESMMSSLTKEGVSDYVDYLQNVVLGGEEKNGADASGLEERRVWALDQIVGLMRNGSVPKEDATIQSVVDFLLVHAFFVIRKVNKKSNLPALHTTPKPALSESTAAACRSKFFSCLVEITTASPPKDSAQSGRQQGSDASGQLWIRKALDTLATLEADKKNVELMLDADDEIKQPRRDAVATLNALSKVQGQDEIKRGVEILLSFIALQTYDETDDALEQLEEVNAAAQKMFNLSSAKASSSTEDDVPPIDTLLDVLIALLDKGSADLRNLANMVVGMVASAFTPSSIEHLVAQLQQHAAETIENDGATSEDGDEVEEEISVDDEEEGGAESSESDDDDDDEVEEDDENDMAPVDPAFRARVAEALKAAGMGVDEDREEGEDDDDESDGEVWDDEQMMKVDEQLAEVFRQRANAGKSSDFKHLHIESIHFKNRILDFFDVFAKKQSTNPVILHIIMPLLRLVSSTSTTEADLSKKTEGILRARIGKAKDVPSTADDFAIKTLEEIHQLVRHSPSINFTAICSLCSAFVARTIDASLPTSTAVVDAYRATLLDYMQRKQSDIHPTFVIDFIKRFPTRAFPLAGDIVTAAAPSGSAKVYRQAQAYLMIQQFSQQLQAIGKTVPHAEIETFVRAARVAMYQTIRQAAEGSAEGWNAARLKDVVKVALHLARTSKAVLGQEKVEGLWASSELKQVVESVKSGEKTKEMKGLISILVQLQSIFRTKDGKKGKKPAQADEEKMDVDGVNGEASPAPKKAKKVKVDGDVSAEKVKKRKSAEGKTNEVKAEGRRKKVKSAKE